MDPEVRIQQFRQMADADPDNELGHFSLGKAYLEAGRFEEAALSLQRVLKLKPTFSKAYHLLGTALDRSGKRNDAIQVMTHGVTVADEQGDRMPRDAMADLLRNWGAAIPAFAETAKTDAPMTDRTSTEGFQCIRCGRPGGQLAKQPFKGPLGEKIHRHVCIACWGEWIPMGTKVINELGLVLASKSGQEAYDQYMIEFLQMEEIV